MNFDRGLSRFPPFLPQTSSFSRFLPSFSFVYDPLCLIRIVFLSMGGRLFLWSRKTNQWLPLRNITHIPHPTINCLTFFRDKLLWDLPYSMMEYWGTQPYSQSECVACKYISVPHICKVPTQVRSYWIPWKCSMDGCEPPCGFLEPNTGALQE